MTRGEVWLAQVGRKRRPVVVLTRPEVIDVRALVTVAEITSQRRGIGAEVELDRAEAGLERDSVINCDGLHTVTRTTLSTKIGALNDKTMAEVCAVVHYALGC